MTFLACWKSIVRINLENQVHPIVLYCKAHGFPCSYQILNYDLVNIKKTQQKTTKALFFFSVLRNV